MNVPARPGSDWYSGPGRGIMGTEPHTQSGGAALEWNILFSDLDGTLLRSDKTLSPATRQALALAAERGVLFVPATGRFFRGMPAAVRELPFLRYAVLMNGALVYDRAEDRALRRAELSPETAVAVLDWLGQFPGTLDCYMEDSCGWMEAAHLADLDHWILDPAAREIVRASRQPMEDLPGYIRRRGRPVQKIQSYFRDPAVQRAVLDGLPARFPEVSAACSLPGNVEITSRDATKGAALEFLCGYLGIPTARSVAFGDERNDCSMLRAAGLGIAMGNASPQARAAAGAVTASNDEDGVARAVLRLLAGERP